MGRPAHWCISATDQSSRRIRIAARHSAGRPHSFHTGAARPHGRPTGRWPAAAGARPTASPSPPTSSTAASSPAEPSPRRMAGAPRDVGLPTAEAHGEVTAERPEPTPARGERVSGTGSRQTADTDEQGPPAPRTGNRPRLRSLRCGRGLGRRASDRYTLSPCGPPAARTPVVRRGRDRASGWRRRRRSRIQAAPSPPHARRRSWRRSGRRPTDRAPASALCLARRSAVGMTGTSTPVRAAHPAAGPAKPLRGRGLAAARLKRAACRRCYEVPDPWHSSLREAWPGPSPSTRRGPATPQPRRAHARGCAREDAERVLGARMPSSHPSQGNRSATRSLIVPSVASSTTT